MVQKINLIELRKVIKRKENEYHKLWELNLEPENQHNWDAMLRLEGYISGLRAAIYYFKNSRRPKIKDRV